MSVNEYGSLLFEGKRVLRKDEIKKCVSKIFKKSKSAEYKKKRWRAQDGYACVSRGNVLKITKNDPNFRRFTVKFTNQAVMKPVISKQVSYTQLNLALTWENILTKIWWLFAVCEMKQSQIFVYFKIVFVFYYFNYLFAAY